MNPFLKIVKEEEDFLLEETNIKKYKWIYLNTPLIENIFLIFFSIYSHIPLILEGKSGSSKSLSLQLIIDIMKSKVNCSNFLNKFPIIKYKYYKCSDVNTPENIENIFREDKNNENVNKNDKEEDIVFLLVFDDLNLWKIGSNNYFEQLNSKLEEYLELSKDNKSFIGISNIKLNISLMNKVIAFEIPDISLEDVNFTISAIADSYEQFLYKKYLRQYDLLGKIYYNYQTKLKDLDDVFYSYYHGYRDLYYLVKYF